MEKRQRARGIAIAERDQPAQVRHFRPERGNGGSDIGCAAFKTCIRALALPNSAPVIAEHRMALRREMRGK